ncbi:MAG: glycosyltransferase family 2 protein [Christensenellales bacterium]|jgi:glycosyltransferase involved in cell wall biosynthesis
MNTPILYIVVPCYNEEEALPHASKRLNELMEDLIATARVRPESRVAFVDDGSKDATWEVICKLRDENPRFEGIKLAHNAGHMNALWAGMTLVSGKCDCLVTIDADLQDDVNAIYGFLDHYMQGADVVYGVRSSRQTDTAFKRVTAQGFYKLMGMMGVEMVYNHADYRLLSRRAVEALLSFGEVNMFLRGMVPLLGFRTAQVAYERGERVAGESKYPLKKMLGFAVDGITSFSNKPIRFVTVIGFLCALLGILMAVYAIVSLAIGRTVAGWASLMMSVWLIGGMQLIAVGMIGEYIGKIYMEVKRRPKFILDRYLHD